MTRDYLKTIVIVTGPTASGKSQFALDLALQHQGVIINADSVQLYRDLPLLSASPTPDNVKKVNHYLYGVLSPLDQWNAALWSERVLDLLKTPGLQDKTPFIVGGTGLYIKGLIEGFVEIPHIPCNYRDQALERLETLGYDQFFQELTKIDPKIAQRLGPRDTQRLIRAWEVYHGSGKPLSYWQDQPKNCKTEHYRFITFCLNPLKSLLIEKADQRFDHMMAQGVLEEVQHLIGQDIPEDAPIYKTLGARPLADYLNGKDQYTLEEAIATAKKSTHHYIKRQQTWFRHQLTSCHKIDDFYSEDALRYGKSVLKEVNH
ncbi:MAG: tRNA (adenosine(37)-N6)-dimethylallyltransferase MiaA [Janthinobacterium lividum]